MGNKLCKKKGDFVDGAQTPNRQRSFKGIISKWNLKPKWKSDSHLNKQRSDAEEKNAKNNQHISNKNIINRPLSKSSDWTDVPLVAATDAESDVVYVKNAQPSLIFNDNHTPTPPPRKHHKKPVGLRAKLKAVAKQGLLAVQSSNTNNNQNYSNRKPVEEPICVKKIINYCCPHCEAVSGTCHRHRAQEASQAAAKAKQTNSNQTNNKSIWDRKASSTSTSSLPTHNGEGKLSIAIDDLEDIDGVTRSSVHSLPGDNNDQQQINRSQPNTSTPIHDNNKIMSRARSFGSLLPQILLHKLSTNPSGANTPSGGNRSGKAPLAEIESDDSFGGLEDWDVGLIEHYNPKDASLPRGVKGVVGAREHSWGVKGGNCWRDSLMSNEDDVLASLEGMIVNHVDEKPEPPKRKSESLIKKITRENSNRTAKTTDKTLDSCQQNLNRSISVTPPPSPEKRMNDPFNNNNQSADHSSLMKIIEDYKHEEDKSTEKTIDLYRNLSTEEALTESISKTTSNVDTISRCDITRKTYMIEDDLSKFDSPNVNEFTRLSVSEVLTDASGVHNNNGVGGSVAAMHNDFLNSERRFVTETDLNLNKYGKMLKI